MMDVLALVAEPAGAVRHQALALRGADSGAEVGLAREAGLTLAAFGRVERDDVVARLHRGDARPDLAHDPRAFMTEDRREDALAVEAVQRVGVGVADARRYDLAQQLTRLRPFELDTEELQRPLCFVCNAGQGFSKE